MTKANTPAPERQGADWREVFLEHLAQTSNVSRSARAAKVDVSTVYKARRSESEFARKWFDALCDGYDTMEMELLHRLRTGVIDNPEAKRKRKFDNASAMRLLGVHRSTVGKIRALRDQEDEEATLAAINEKLDMMRERMRAANELLDQDGEQNGNTNNSDEA